MNASRWILLFAAGAAMAPATVPAQVGLQGQPLMAPPFRDRAGNAAAPAPAVRIEGPVIINNGLIIEGFFVGAQGNGVIGGNAGGEPAKIEPDPTGAQVLEFTDGQRLHGTLAGFDAGRGLMQWQRPDASTALPIALDQITRWSTEVQASPGAEPAGPAATVKFSGGDWLVGKVASIQGDKTQLQLPDGTPLTTHRDHVEWIYFSKTAGAETYDGPTSMAGWTSPGNWTYRDGALRASTPSPISRNFEALPDQVEYRLVVDQGAITKAFTLTLHARNAARLSTNRGVLQLMLRGTTLNLWGSIGGKFKSVQTEIGSVLGNALQAREPMLFRILEDATKGRLLVYINDRKAAEWDIDKIAAGKNGGLFQFQPTSWSGDKEQSISMIKVLPWDGLEPGQEEERTEDRVSLTTGEVRKGKFTGWDGRTLKMTTAAGTLSVPAAEIALLRFRRPPEPPEDQAPMAHLRLASRGEFDVVALSWRDGKFRARTNFGGEIALAPGAIAELAFSRLPGKVAPAEDLLVFFNGDKLRGSLEAADGKGILRWRPNPAGPVIEFAPTHVAGVQFASRAPATPGPAGAGMVARFRNGDWLPGTFVTLDREQIVLNAVEAGQLSVPRTGLQALYFHPEGRPAVSDGVSDHAEWEKGLVLNTNTSVQRQKLAEAGNLWSYFAGAYTRSGASGADGVFNRAGGIQLGRLFETMGPRAEVSFKVKTVRQPVYFSAQLFSEPSNPGYMLNVSVGALSIYDMNPRPRGRGIAQQQFPFSKEIKPTASERHIRILADRTTGRMTVFVDGVHTAQMNPRTGDGPRQLGRGIMISPQANQPITVSNLWVGPWSGILPAKTPPEKPSPESVALVNGDEVAGTVEGATPATLKIASDVGPLELPLERLAMVDFGGQPNPPGLGTRLHLVEGGSLTVTAWRIEEAMVVCQSENAGELRIPLKAIQEIVFAAPSKP